MVQTKLHTWLYVLTCFPVVISDQLQSLVTCNRAAGQFEGSAGMGGFVVITCNRVAGQFEGSAGMGGFVVITCNRVAGRFEGSAGMGGFVMLSLATERLDGLRGMLVWEVLFCYY